MKIMLACAALFVPLAFSWGQGASGSLIVTAEPKHGNELPAIQQQDIRVTEAGKPATVSGFSSLDGSGLQLLFLIDDSASTSFGTEINTIREFINSLPPTTQVGVAYMRNGFSQFTQQFTSDHSLAANSVRLSLGAGGADVSPYDSLSEAIKHWQPAPDIQRREVIMISSGIEALGGGLAPENPYVNKSIADAQRAGVVVYGIYNPNFGHEGHSLWRVTYGQNLLSQLCDETGGECYMNTFTAAVDFGPYLREIATNLQRQYLLTFSLGPVKKSSLERVKVKVAEKNADLAAADAVYVR